MRLSGVSSISTPARILLGTLLVIAGIQVALTALVVGILLVDPLHPVRDYFRVTTLAAVPSEVWKAEGLVQVDSGSATARVAPWAYITYRPSSRAFVLVAAAAAFLWWGCLAAVLLYLWRAFRNLSADAPFPRANVRCIRLVGWGILGMAAVDLLIDAGMFAFMRVTTTVAGRPPVIPTDMLLVDFPLGTILAGLAVVILAEVFRAGADLQDDQALTI